MVRVATTGRSFWAMQEDDASWAFAGNPTNAKTMASDLLCI